MNNKVAWFFVICIGLGLLFVIGRSNGMVYGGLFGGRVIDEATQQPVVGAYVIARWEGRTFHERHCVHMDIETTDENGEFFFFPWIDFVNFTVFSQNKKPLLAYAPGYEKMNHSDPIRLKKHGDTPKERIKELRRLSTLFCGSASRTTEELEQRVRREMYRESKLELSRIEKDPDGELKFRVELMKDACGRLCE